MAADELPNFGFDSDPFLETLSPLTFESGDGSDDETSGWEPQSGNKGAFGGWTPLAVA
jgi:hypothetical protein